MTAINRINNYLIRRKTPATAKEIAFGTKLSPHTVRKELGFLQNIDLVFGDDVKMDKTSGRAVTAYSA